MNHALTLRPPAPLRIWPLLVLCFAFWLASAVSMAPTLARSASGKSVVCKCAHCKGGLACCCRLAGRCLTP
jgi:hypothetical protein